MDKLFLDPGGAARLMSYFRHNIREMAGYTPGYQPVGEDYIKLNTNENPYPPSPRVIESIRAACGVGLRKYPDPVANEFREAAAEMLGTDPARILCGNGSDELLTIAVRSFCGGGDALAYPYPSYSLYESLAQIQGARARTVDFPEDFSLPDGLARTGARLVLISNPNAPTGTVIPPQELQSLARAIGGVLLVDEAYVDFAEGDCLALTESCDNVIVTRTLSKSYSLAGLRFGYCVAHQDIIAGMTKVKDSYNVDAASMAGAVAAVRDRQWMLRNVEKIKATRRRLAERLEAMGFHCWPSQANFVLARVPQGQNAAELYQALFDRKILVRYFKMRRLDDCLRITVGTDEQVDALLAALQDILTK